MNYKLPLLLLFCSFSAQAEIYKWTDANGQVHFGDKPSGAQTSEQVTLEETNGFAAVVDPARITIYTAKWCKYCHQAKRHMKAEGIKYKEKDIDTSPIYKREHKKLGGGLPLILSNNRKMRGFSKARFKRFMDR